MVVFFFSPTGCPKGLYGKQCNKKCNCAHNGRCHRTYGACLCDPGLYGRFCHLRECLCSIIAPNVFSESRSNLGLSHSCLVFHSVACPKWVFGPGCSEECKCVRENTQECHRRDGTCACKPGYQGAECAKGPNHTENYK